MLFSQNNQSNPVNYSGIPCQYVGIGKVIESSKDTSGRNCILDDYSNGFSLVTLWHYKESVPSDWINPMTIIYDIVYMCPVSTIIMQGTIKNINQALPKAYVMIDTLDDKNLFKKLYKSHCGG
jgi:hypothetical protein